MRLRTNLATRPFYNVRAVQVALGLLGVVVFFFTLYNGFRFMSLNSQHSQKAAHAVEAEAEGQRLRAEAARIRSQIDQKELAAVAEAAREANGIIDRRAFSWTELLTQLESTLPADVRITTVQPRVDRGILKVGLVAEARNTEDVNDFVEALEKTGAFRNVVPVQRMTSEDGVIRMAIDSDYEAPVRQPAEAPASAPAPGPGAARE